MHPRRNNWRLMQTQSLSAKLLDVKRNIRFAGNYSQAMSALTTAIAAINSLQTIPPLRADEEWRSLGACSSTQPINPPTPTVAVPTNVSSH